MSERTQKEGGGPGQEPGGDDSWISLDDVIERAPVPFVDTRAGKRLLPRRCCCCCCCCCCKEEKEEKEAGREARPEPAASGLSVTLDAEWEMLVNPARLGSSIQAGIVIQALRAEFRWSARGGREITVDVEVRTEDPDGAPGGRFPDWQAILEDQPPVEIATWNVDHTIGNTARFRARATDGDGNVAYSEIITVSPGRPSL